MVVESVIQQILASRRDLTREEIIKMIEDKVNSARGYFTPEIAAQIVASELGVQTPQRNLQSKILIRNLVSGLNDVTITGRVIHVPPSQSFTHSDGTEGVVKRLLIADESGVMKAVLWNDMAKIADEENIKLGKIVKFSHGYVREGTDGKIELNLGTRGEIKVLQQDELKNEYPPLESFIQRIRDITEKNRRVNVSGVVQRLFQESLFKRKDGSQGKMRRLWLRDSTGQIEVVFWNNRVEEIENLREGKYLRIMSARAKSQLNGQLELHVEEASNVEVETEIPSESMFPPTRLMKVKEIRDETRKVNVLARVAYVGDVRKIKSGEDRYLSQLLIEDETGSIQLNLWEDKASLSKEIKLGDVLHIKGAYTRRRFGKTSLDLDNKGSILINPSIREAENLPKHVEKIIKVANIKEGEYVTIEGNIVTKPSVREVTTARNERVKVASFELSDDTGKVDVSLWRKLADTAEKLSVGDHVKIINVYIQKNLSGQLKINSSMLTSIEKMSEKD